MGLPVERLVVATNVNDILDRTLSGGRYEMRGVTQTASPSMDIEVSSNFERMLFEAAGRDPASVRRLMASLAQSGSFALGEKERLELADVFASGACGEAECLETIARVRRKTGLIIDPHTAVGVAVAERHLGEAPMITLATAHPAKFPDAVEAACGIRPELPDWARGILAREENYRVMPADLRAVERAIEAGTRAAEGVA
jgi:threonine synthase